MSISFNGETLQKVLELIIDINVANVREEVEKAKINSPNATNEELAAQFF